MGTRRARPTPQVQSMQKALRQLLQLQTDPVARAEIERFLTELSPQAGPAHAPAEALIQRFTELGGREVRQPREVGAKPIVYCVINGPHILQIGQGKASRLKRLFSGSICPKHTKAFVVAASSVVHGRGLRFFCFEVEDAPERRRLEGELQIHFGKHYLHGFGRSTSLLEVSNHLWLELKRLKASALTPELIAMLELALHDGDVLYTIYRARKYRDRLETLFDGYYTG